MGLNKLERRHRIEFGTAIARMKYAVKNERICEIAKAYGAGKFLLGASKNEKLQGVWSKNQHLDLRLIKSILIRCETVFCLM